ncbi:MAG: DUF3267 domain-containing protein [Chloroflexota bacterium]
MKTATPTRQLPEGYTLTYSLHLKANKSAVFWMQVATIPVFILSAWFFAWLVLEFRFDAFLGIGRFNNAALLIGLVAVNLIVLVVHELAHGLFIWVFTRHRPVYGWHWFYAYAGAPDWYFDKLRYIVIALAPLVLISTVGVALILVSPAPVVLFLLGIAVFNATGAVGDLWLVLKSLFEPDDVLIRDTGDGFEFYRRG